MWKTSWFFKRLCSARRYEVILTRLPIGLVQLWVMPWQASGCKLATTERESEREREIYLKPDQPGCGHKAADTAESSERRMTVCLPGRSTYRSDGDLSSYVTKLYR